MRKFIILFHSVTKFCAAKVRIFH